MYYFLSKGNDSHFDFHGATEVGGRIVVALVPLWSAKILFISISSTECDDSGMGRVHGCCDYLGFINSESR